jgi:acetyltransferase-like isoleucine patch superfamily enzyme
LPQDKLIAIILDVATKDYRPTLSIERRMIGKLLTVDNLENAMMEEYRQLIRNQFKPSGTEGNCCCLGKKCVILVVAPVIVQMNVLKGRMGPIIKEKSTVSNINATIVV